MESANRNVQVSVANKAPGRASLKVLSSNSSFFALAIFSTSSPLLDGEGLNSGFVENRGLTL